MRDRERSSVRALGLAALAGVALLAAGCGGGSKPRAVASLGTTASHTTGSRPLLFPAGIGGVGASISTQVGAAGVRYTACMRSHGVPGFPDPDARGELTIVVSSTLNPSSPRFQRAEAGCQRLVPAGKGLSPARQLQLKTRLLAFAACMRAHGVPGYPDPTFSNGGVSQGLSRRDVDSSSPAFKAAQTTCQRTHGNGGSA
jgi:hypothetical protein